MKNIILRRKKYNSENIIQNLKLWDENSNLQNIPVIFVNNWTVKYTNIP